MKIKLEVKYVKVNYEKLSWKSPDLVKAHLNKAHLKNDLKDDSTFKDLKDDGHLQVKINGDDHLQVTIITIF